MIKQKGGSTKPWHLQAELVYRAATVVAASFGSMWQAQDQFGLGNLVFNSCAFLR